MDILIDGTKGSGKSYYAVNYIAENYKKYATIYCNINGFKFNRVHTRHVVVRWIVAYDMSLLDYYYQYKIYKGVNWMSPPNVRALNWDKILDVVQDCKDIYDRETQNINEFDDTIELDDLFIDYLLDIGFIHHNPAYQKNLDLIENRKRKNFISRFFLNIFSPVTFVPQYLTVLVVIDEANNFFDKRSTDPLLVWLMSYSRHMYIDFILLTQSNTDINQTYLKRMESFFFALPTERQTRPGYRKYKKHIKVPYYDSKGGTHAGDVFVKEKQEVFNLYKSGNKTNSTSIFIKYIIYLLLFIVTAVGFAIFLFNYYFATDVEVVDTTEKKNTKNVVVKKIINKITSDLPDHAIYIKFNCINNECVHDDIRFNIADLPYVLEATGSKYLRSKEISKNYSVVHILASQQFRTLFIGANENETNNNSLGGIFK